MITLRLTIFIMTIYPEFLTEICCAAVVKELFFPDFVLMDVSDLVA